MIRTPLRRSSRLRRTQGLRPHRKTRKGRISEKTLDDLWSDVVRTRDGFVCQRCRVSFAHKKGSLDGAHVIGRKYRGTRWDPDNGVALCKPDHAFFGDNPVLAGRFFDAHVGWEQCDWLWAKARAAVKVDRAAVRAYLKALLEKK